MSKYNQLVFDNNFEISNDMIINYCKNYDDLKDRRIINKNEHRLIFKLPKLISEGVFEQTLKHINRQNEEAAEEFYKTNSKKDDYQL